jgi:hypothetical protein
LSVSATECAVSASIALEPVMSPAASLAAATTTLAAPATSTVRRVDLLPAAERVMKRSGPGSYAAAWTCGPSRAS